MAMKVRYTVIEGEVVSEVRSGTRRDYLPDPLGSTVALLDNNQAKTDTWEYWPYGEVRTRTGTTATPFQFVGTLGYFRDTSTRTYVRARHYKQNQGRWMTVDPLWPRFEPYAYSSNLPTRIIDPSGQCPFATEGCTARERYDLCSGFNFFCAAIKNKVDDCLSIVPCGRGSYPGITDALDDLCSGSWNGPSSITIKCDKGGIWGEPVCKDGACGGLWGNKIIICQKAWGKNCRPLFCLLLHELMHLFGGTHGDASFECLKEIPSCKKYE